MKMTAGGTTRYCAASMLTLLTILSSPRLPQSDMMTDAMASVPNNPVEESLDETNPPTTNSEILLESFKGNIPLYAWTQMNDPVMGVKSTGFFEVEDSARVMDRNVEIVNFLKVETVPEESWPDIS